MPKIEVYMTPTCPFCIRAIGLLNKKDVTFEEHNVASNPELRAKMIDRANGKTSVPQIFIDDKLIGGSDDLQMLDANDELDALLNG